ncbi:MAG TPA: T9SS type A sorting domain-containing protein, partial [Bacteroidetes bacterium]|nr:T9SS type A sorting domain-containing protein [Bacteroidota bacterium]
MVYGISQLANAQEKYAVLITGDYAATNVPIEDQWNQGQGKSINGFEEFWYDTYLMWEMLVFEKGYSDENIFVLFASGTDFTKPNMWSRYTAAEHGLDHITDFSATITNVENVFTGLTTGSGGFPQVTEDDFLFVWTFDHGGPGPGQTGPVYLCLLDGNMWDYEFAALTDPIAAHKKVFWMQQCRSGGFYDDLEAINTVFHSACQPEEYARPADNVDLSGNQVEEWDFYYSGGDYYRHGEFNFHVYSATIGESPAFVDNYNGQPYTEADENNDNYISVLESYNWEDAHESIDVGGMYPGEDPLLSDLGNIGANTSLEYPTLLHTDITVNETYRGLIGISKDVHITSGKQLQLISNSEVYLLNNADLIVDAGATLIIEDNVTISGNATNKIIVNGDIQIGQNVTFNKHGSTGYFYGLVLNNSNMQTIIDNVTFNETQLGNYGSELDITNSTFNDCSWVYSFHGDVTIDDCIFTETTLFLENQANDPDLLAWVNNSIFNNTSSLVGIDLWNYDNYWIDNNDIMASYNGIQIFNSGNGNYIAQQIFNNSIHNCGWAGILAYGTNGIIEQNHIYDNQTGIKLMNKCNMALYGDPNANSFNETNYITDNDGYEIYISKYSFPWYFRYNAIIDEDNLGNPDDPMVYYEPQSGGFQLIDVKYNCWGNNFDAAEDLYPSGYMVNPTWCPGGGGQKSSEVALQTFLDGEEHFENEEYADAKTTFESVVELYPNTQYAGAAMKELFTLEKFTDNDYSALKQYYETNDSIQADTVLTKLATFLSNKCEIKLENWQTAIDHFEDVIDNPESTEDSIFAIIDLGNTYLLMGDSTERGTARGRMLQYIPKSREAFAAKRNYLLSLLPVTKNRQKPDNLFETSKQEILLQNAPNPFSNTTTVYYRLSEPCSVTLKVFDHVGREVKRINETTQNAGLNKIELDMNGLPAGIYFYSIFINGQLSDTKKMVLL